MDAFALLARLASHPSPDDLALSALPGAPVRPERHRRRRSRWTRSPWRLVPRPAVRPRLDEAVR